MDAPSPSSTTPLSDPGAEALVPNIGARGATQDGHAVAVRRMFDTISPTYDLLNRLMSFGIDVRWRKQALAALFRDLPSEGPMLDLCAGTLDLTVALEQRDPSRMVVSADFAREMLVAGRAKPGRAHLAQADAMRMPFATDAFAGVVCGFGMRNLGEPKRGIAEVYRALKPGGVFVVLEFFRPTRFLTHAFHTMYGNVLLPLVGGLVSGDRSAYAYLSQSMRGFLSREEFAQAMREAGFHDVYSKDLTLGIASLIVGVK